MPRTNIYISHSFQHADKYVRIVEFLEQEGIPTANYSVPAWRKLEGEKQEKLDGITERIRLSSAVIVLLTPGIHDSYYIAHEIESAKFFGKPIIGIYPHGENEAPIPRILDGHLTHAIGWRSGSLRRALDGEYPLERRSFDIAEVRERLELTAAIGSLAAVATFIVAGWTTVTYRQVQADLRAKGVTLTDEPSPGPSALGGAAIGAVIGILTPALLGSEKNSDLLIGAVIGAAGGAALGVSYHYVVRKKKVLGRWAELELERVGR